MNTLYVYVLSAYFAPRDMSFYMYITNFASIRSNTLVMPPATDVTAHIPPFFVLLSVASPTRKLLQF